MPSRIDLPGKWLLNELAMAADSINNALDQYRFSDAAEQLYHLIWTSFCDWGLEAAKNTFEATDEAAKEQVASVLVFVIDGILRLASPVMPFVTEKIWQALPAHSDWDRPVSLAVAKYPEGDRLPRFPAEAAAWKSVQDLVSGIRSLRSQAGIAPRTKVPVVVRAEPALAATFTAHQAVICRLASISDFSVAPSAERPGQCMVDVGRGFETYIPAAGLIDVEKEKVRLKGEVERIDKIVTRLDAKLATPSFVDRAPADVVEQTREQRANLGAQLDGLRKSLEALN